MMGGGTVRIRSLLLEEGISFYELEEKASPGQKESPAKSMAREFMSSYGISVQDLKKGTVYEELEMQGKTKEDVDKEVKAMWELRKALYYNRKNYDDDDDDDAEEEALLLSIQQALKERENDAAAMNKDNPMHAAAGANINGIILSEEALKDMEMHRDDLYVVMTKRMKKLAKIEKKKMLKLREKMMKMRLAEHRCHSTTPRGTLSRCPMNHSSFQT